MRWRIAALMAAGLLASCAGEDGTDLSITPGAGIGEVQVGMTYAGLRATLGEPDSLSLQSRIALAGYDDFGIEVLFTTANNTEVTDDAVAIAVGARPTRGVAHRGCPRPGQSRAEIEAELGEAPEVVGAYHYYPVGVSVEYDSDEVAFAVGVFAPYALAPEPPPMKKAGAR